MLEVKVREDQKPCGKVRTRCTVLHLKGRRQKTKAGFRRETGRQTQVVEDQNLCQ